MQQTKPIVSMENVVFSVDVNQKTDFNELPEYFQM